MSKSYKIRVSEETYEKLINAYCRYKNLYPDIDEFIRALVDTYLQTDPEYSEPFIEELVREVAEQDCYSVSSGPKRKGYGEKES